MPSLDGAGDDRHAGVIVGRVNDAERIGLRLPALGIERPRLTCFGILANFGVGNYAPTLVMLSLMGMNPKLAFPIMAGGAALMGAGSSFQHVRIGKVDLKVVLGLAIGGIPAVLVAVYVVKEMPIDYLRWLVVIVVLYAAAVMARASLKGRREGTIEAAEAPFLLKPEPETGA